MHFFHVVSDDIIPVLENESLGSQITHCLQLGSLHLMKILFLLSVSQDPGREKLDETNIEE